MLDLIIISGILLCAMEGVAVCDTDASYPEFFLLCLGTVWWFLLVVFYIGVSDLGM